MSAGEFVFARLANQTSAGTRVYPLLLPESPTLPGLTYQEISTVRTHAMGRDGPVLRVRLQLNAWGESYRDARTLADQAAALLSRWKGTLVGVTVLDVLLDNDTMTFEPDTNLRRVMQDYTLFINS